MKLGSLVVLGMVGLMGGGAGCSSSSGGGSGGGGSCDQISGTWNISGTCTVSSCTISQNGCGLTMGCNNGESFNGSLSGSSASFSNADTSCSGSLSGSTGSGTCTSQGSSCNWSATKQGGGGSGGSGGFGGGGSGGTGGGDSVCKTCIGAKCNTEAAACGKNADCYALLKCIANCSDDPCMTGCENQYPGGISDLNTYLGCISNQCKTECGL